MVWNICQMYCMKFHRWWFLLLCLNMLTVWLLKIIMAGKQFQFYLDIICNLDKFYIVLIKFVYLLPLNCMRDRILSLVSVQGTNGGQNHEKLIQYFIISVCLMCWLSILYKLDCSFFCCLLFIMQYIDNQLIARDYLPMQKY